MPAAAGGEDGDDRNEANARLARPPHRRCIDRQEAWKFAKPFRECEYAVQQTVLVPRFRCPDCPFRASIRTVHRRAAPVQLVFANAAFAAALPGAAWLGAGKWPCETMPV